MIDDKSRLTRRTFLSKGVRSTITVGLSFPMLKRKHIDVYQDNLHVDTKEEFNLAYRILGRTGLKVTTVSYGAMRTRDPGVIHRALDLGINYIDTARRYMNGYNEVVVGKVLKKRRQDAYVATKILPGHFTYNQIMKSMEESLKALQVDYVDVIQLHNIKNVEHIKNEEAMETLQKIKEDSKARFIGFSTHRNQAALLNAAAEMDFYDMILVAYNFKSSPEVGKAIEKAAKAGIGIVVMKTQAGGYTHHKMGNLSPHQAALKWVFQNHGVANAIPSMVTYSQIEENVKVMGSKMGWFDRKALYRYEKVISKTLCRMCDACCNLCPHGVDVLDVNRCLMYAEGYGDYELARETYRLIPDERRPNACRDCVRCRVRCVNGLDIRSKMTKALEIFA